MKIILDTNVLLLYGQGIDVLAEVAAAIDEKVELLVPECVLTELHLLAQKGSKDGRAAKLAFVIVQQRLGKKDFSQLLFPTIPLKMVPCSSRHADDAILKIAEDDPARHVVATLDKGLQRRLLHAGVCVLTVHKKRFQLKEV